VAAVVAGPAVASTDFPAAYQHGWTAVTVEHYTKSYVYYDGGGSFTICARAENRSGTTTQDCGTANQASPQARLLHCGGALAAWSVYNGDNSAHNMIDRLYFNPC
jgi:hypothetical protein